MVFSSLLGAPKAGRRHSRSSSHGDDQLSVNDSYAPSASSSSSVSSASAPPSPSSPPTALPLPPDFIADEEQLAPVAPEPPDLRELNNSLDALAAVFPDVQVDVFREMLTSFDGESRLALVADALLKSRATWVKGRWRVAGKEKEEGKADDAAAPRPADGIGLSSADRFRTPAYQKAAQALACREFVGLSRSTIHAVLAEHNYAYLEARRALVQLSSKSWRFTLSSLLLLRRRPVTSAEAENHPLVVWKSSGQGSILPTIKATGSPELDRELYDALVAPLRARQRAAQEDADRGLAAALNTAEAEAAGATYECTCCFATVPFEEVTTCSGSPHDADANTGPPHVVCFRCVQHSVREAVFGQGWARTIDSSRGTLRCPAVDRTDCPGIIPVDHLHRALLDEKRGADTLRHLERRLADHSLVGSGLPLVRCPFCAYAEVDDLYVPFHEAPLRLRLLGVDRLYSLALVLLLFGATPMLVLPVVVLVVLWTTVLPGCTALHGLLSRVAGTAATATATATTAAAAVAAAATATSSSTTPYCRTSTRLGYLRGELAAAVTRFRRRRRGQQFRCQDPACGRVSCLSCGKAWTDIHVCHESSLVALRTQVEQAMSMAIKRVCPRCHTSFVKTAGCNKLTCPCGYKMCYVCRKDISGGGGGGDPEGPDVGYRHFCQHFRPHGDGRPCTQCRRCNLWESEDTEAVLQAAREAAERKWRETERRELSLSERAYLETGIAVGGGTAAAAAAASRSLWASPLSWGFGDKAAAAAADGPDGPAAAAAALLPRLPTLAEALDWLLESVLV